MRTGWKRFSASSSTSTKTASRRKSRLYDGLQDALDRFVDAGWRLAVCTNKMEAASIKLLEALGVAHMFAAICGQDTHRDDGKPVSKPDARALTMTIALAGGDAGNTIMVGDSKTDILTAKNAGVPVVAVDFGYTDVHVSQLGPDVVISHFADLWDAVCGIRAPRRGLRADGTRAAYLTSRPRPEDIRATDRAFRTRPQVTGD